jgi:hypothetical protein
MCIHKTKNCIYIYIYILYNVRVTWSVLDNSCTCYATEDAIQIVNWFITLPITRNYIHSQLFIRLSPLHSLQSYTFVTTITYYTLTLSYTLSYQLLSQIITHFTSSHFPCLPPIETSLVELLLNNSSRELTRRTAPYELLHSHSGNWTKSANSFAYIAEPC